MAATVWRGRIAFGMVSIPVRLLKAARRERIQFHHVYRPAELPEIDEPVPESTPAPDRSPAGPYERPEAAPDSVARVRSLPVLQTSEAAIPREEILKGFEIEKDRYVTFAQKEIAALRPRTSTELTISEFVHLKEVDPIFFETSYYAVPDRGGEQPYVLLFQALTETKYAALGSLAMHGREHSTLIRPGEHGLIVHTLFFENEVRAEQEYQADWEPVDRNALDLAKRFVEALAAPFDPGKLKDPYETRLRELIDARKGTAAATSGGQAERRAPVIDIMDALRKSLEMARKPPKREETPKPSRATAPKTRRVRSR